MDSERPVGRIKFHFRPAGTGRTSRPSDRKDVEMGPPRDAGVVIAEVNPQRGSSKTAYTESFAALTGRARTIFRAGLALNVIGSLVKGLVPWRSFVAGFLITTNFAKPGTRKTPVLLSSLYPMTARVSKTSFTPYLWQFGLGSDLLNQLRLRHLRCHWRSPPGDSCSTTIGGAAARTKRAPGDECAHRVWRARIARTRCKLKPRDLRRLSSSGSRLAPR
jgi:hypothetical protein